MSEPTSSSDLAALEADARFHRERLALYRARRYSSRPTSEARYQELERAEKLASSRLLHARRRSAHLN